MSKVSRIGRFGPAVVLVGVLAAMGCGSSSTDPNLDDDLGFDPQGEGCTVEFWRLEANLQHWSEDYPPDRPGGTYFPGHTYHDVLWLDGDGLNALGRETVASILNAAHPDIDFGLRPSQVIGAFNEAAAEEDYDGLRSLLQAMNHRTCPL